MVKFAVCDDEHNMTDYISDKLREYYPGECEIKRYTDSEILLADSRRELFDAFFLDIGMPRLDGMKLAEKIREDDEFVIIVFVTNKEELAHVGYIYRAFRYVRKSRLEQDLRETAESLKKYFDSLNDCLSFKTPTGDITRDVKSIKYFEVKGHDVTIVCDESEEQVCGTMKAHEERMKNKGFIRIHNGYLANFRYIHSIDNRHVKLTDGEELPLSRNRIDGTKKKFLEFTRSIIRR